MTVAITASHSLINWILEEGQPWVRYRTWLDLLDKSEHDPDVVAARQAMVEHPQVQGLTAALANWPAYALKRHNDAKHPLHKLSTLADFGMIAHDPGIENVLERVLALQSTPGSFQLPVNIPVSRGGTGESQLVWMLCGAPTLLYALLSFGLDEHPQVEKAITHLTSLVRSNGWPCAVDSELGKFRGPGRKADPCPYANLISLKALSLVPGMIESNASHLGAETLLWHWETQSQRKVYMFGIGSDFRKIKYPFIWYDILHVADVLSRYPHVHDDLRFHQMIDDLMNQADEEGRFTAQSMYRAWKDWEFADKKNPSHWLTFLVLRIAKRIGRLEFT